MKLNNLVEGFLFGELSPLMAGQISTNFYKQSAKTLINMYPDTRGPAMRRPGWVHVASLDAARAELFDLQVSSKQSYMLAFSGSKLDVFPSSRVENAPDLLLNGDFAAGVTAWCPFIPADATLTFERLNTEFKASATESIKLRQVFEILENGDYELLVDGLFTAETAGEAVVVKIGTTDGGTELATVNLFGDLTYQQVPFTATTGPVYLELEVKARTDAEPTGRFNRLRVQAQQGSLTPVTITTGYPYSDKHLPGLTVYNVPNTTEVYILHKDIAPHKLDYSTWTLSAIVFTATPVTWIAGNYPTALTFHQGRAFYGGFETQPETFMASKSGTYTDMTMGINPADALSFTIDRSGRVRWIISSKNLLLGTDNSEYVISAEGVVIMPDDIQIDLQSAHGSSEVVPVLVGTETVFVSLDRKILRGMSYFWEENGWVADNLTFGSEQVTRSSITGMSLARNPEPVLWLTLGDGVLAGCSYQFKGSGSKEARQVGWHRHMTNGAFTSCAVVEDYGRSIPWVAVTTRINNVPKLHIGYLDFGAYEPSYLDNSVKKTYNALTTTVTGLEYMEGEQVEVLIDGATHATLTVVAGAIELNWPGQKVVIGRPFTSKLVTQPVALMTKDGALMHQMGRWTEAYVYIVDSYLPKIEGRRAAEFSFTSRMGYRQDRITGYVISTQTGWERDSVLTIEQDLPYPLTITHISGAVDKTL